MGKDEPIIELMFRVSAPFWHRISQVDPAARTGMCSLCGPVRVKPRWQSGEVRGWRCKKQFGTQKSRRSDRTRWGGSKLYRRFVGASCNQCGFVPDHPGQLDVDHIDGDHDNDDPANLQTLCANCHRLKTFADRGSVLGLPAHTR